MATMVHERHQVLDIFVEAEAPGREGHVAGIAPVGDIDVAIGQHGLHGGAQKGCEMAGHGGGQQHLGLRRQRVLLETEQACERGFEHHVLAHGDATIGDLHRLDAERPPLMGDAGGGEDFGPGSGQANADIFPRARKIFQKFQPQRSALARRC
jgi:hypothetical protein